RSDNVVRLVPRRIDHRNVKGLAQSDYVWKLTSEVIGHCFAISFVVRKCFVPKGLLFRLENGSDVVGLLFTQQLNEHVGEDVYRLSNLSLRCGKWRCTVLHRRVKRT